MRNEDFPEDDFTDPDVTPSAAKRLRSPCVQLDDGAWWESNDTEE